MQNEISFVDLQISDPMKFEHFRMLQEHHRSSYLEVKLDTYEMTIRDLAVKCCQKSLTLFKEENRIP